MMSLWRALTHGLCVLFRRDRADRELADEIRDYVERSTAAYIDDGLSPAEARRAARLDAGSAASVLDEVRSSGWEHAIDTFRADVLYSLRRLLASPMSTAITAGTLAIGVGATSAIVGGIQPILFDPLPYPAPGDIVTILEMRDDRSRAMGSFGMYRALAERSHSYESLCVFKPWKPIATGADRAEQLRGQRVSYEYFDVLGIPPQIGRDFQGSDDRAASSPVVILSDRLWRRRFNADPAVVGRPVVLDDIAFSVIGVMPADFVDVLEPEAELWAPLQYELSQGRAWGHHLRTIGRLKADASLEAAALEIGALGPAIVSELRPETYASRVGFATVLLQDDLTADVKPALHAVLAAVVLVLLIAAVNATSLLVARGAGRRAEFALRAALGAGRRRLIQQVLIECLLIAAIAGILAMGLAAAGVRMIAGLSASAIPRANAIGVNASLFVIAACVAAVTGILVGLIPAFQGSREDPQARLKSVARTTSGGHQRLRAALVVTEVALALVLLVASGLLLRSMQRLFAVDPGFDPANVLTVQVQVSGGMYRDDAVVRNYFEDALVAVRNLPGVLSAAATSQLPISGDSDEYGVQFESSTEGYNTFRYAVSDGYFDTMRIPLRGGRLLTAHDRETTPLVAVISESLADRRFPATDPLGQRLRIGAADGPLYTIVGVVGDIRQQSLARSEADAVYITARQWRFGDRTMSLVVRTFDRPAAVVAGVRAVLESLDKNQPIIRVATLTDLLEASAAERRVALRLFQAFAITALALAAAGIYGVLAGSVAERTREIGIRSALGASRRGIVMLVLRQGMTMTAAGMLAGVVLAFASMSGLRSMLFGISAVDGVTYVSVLGILGVVTLLACVVPASRAARVDPALTLRAE